MSQAGEMWRYSNNDYGPEDGLESPNTEPFRKDPLESGTRETGQNGIDANYDKLPTRIVYKSFIVAREDIPGIEQLSEQINKCYEYKKNDLNKEAKPLKRMLKCSKESSILCLRISDFNTTGLLGVKDNDRDKPFYLLTKGSGVSNKPDGKGGSKGIGKYATFVNSELNTVFYSTYTKDEEKGFIGVAKLRSVPLDAEGKLMTQDMHYYCRNEKKEPILRELTLDKDFSRKEYGTDIYIIGFKENENWEWKVVSKFLESFMVAFKYKTLEVEVNDILISESTLPDLVASDELRAACGKRLYNEILAQYSLLNDDDVFKATIPILNYGDVDVFVKKYDMQNKDLGIRKCVLVRYPYMKIKLTDTLGKLPFSAMCVIGNNELNKKLRAVENAQHTNWEFNRLDDKDERRETKAAEKELRTQIINYVNSVIFTGETKQTDLYGAGDFLASQDDLSDTHANDSNVYDDSPTISNTRPTITTPRNEKFNDDSDAFDFDTGSIGDEDENGTAKKRKKKRKGHGGTPKSKLYKKLDGTEAIMTKEQLTGISFNNIVTDEQKGQYDILFTAPSDEKEFEIEIGMYGYDQDTYSVPIDCASVNGLNCTIIDGKVRLSVEKNKAYKISYSVAVSKMFSSEVIFNAYRE